MIKLSKVEKNTITHKCGFKQGDVIIAINGEKVVDMLDVAYFDSLSRLNVEIVRDGKNQIVKVNKGFMPMDWEFDSSSYIQPKWCANKCVFCFVDQLPQGCRKTLYVKDDDWRLSFVSGNFVTLTNITDEDLLRILKRQYSPLYVSVHATDEELRKHLLGNQKARPILPLIETLTAHGISLHTQIVLCQNLNDGKQLEKSVNDLYKFFPYVKSLAVVPVGITKHRKNLNPLTPVDKQTANATIDFIEAFDQKVYEKHGCHWVYCSDEMYVVAQRDLPSYDKYGDFEQIENGVGLIADFNYQFQLAFESAISAKQQGFTVVTGVAASQHIKDTVERLKKSFPDLKANVLTVENQYFGSTVTVAGLIVGKDIENAVKTSNTTIYENLLIPKVMLKENEDVFLDGMTLQQLKESLAREIIVVSDGYEFCQALVNVDE